MSLHTSLRNGQHHLGRHWTSANVQPGLNVLFAPVRRLPLTSLLFFSPSRLTHRTIFSDTSGGSELWRQQFVVALFLFTGRMLTFPLLFPKPFYFLARRYPSSFFKYVNMPLAFSATGLLPPALPINVSCSPLAPSSVPSRPRSLIAPPLAPL